MITSERQIEMLELSKLLTPFLNLTSLMYKQVASTQCTMDYMKALKSSLCLTLTERFRAKEQFFYAGRAAKKNLLRVFENEAYILATLLDPRWKLSPFEIPLDEPYQLKRHVPSIERVKALLFREYNLEASVVENETTLREDPVPEKIARTDFLSSFITTHGTEPYRNLQNEVEEYLQEKRVDRDSDPLEYYRKKSEIGRFPILCKLARKYLGFPSTSSSMERVFSITGSLNRARRASLATETMEKFVIYREFRNVVVGT